MRLESLISPHRENPDIMYVIAIHVPLFIDGDKCYVATDWMRSLELLRDSLAPRISRFTLVAPSRPADADAMAQTLEQIDEDVTGFRCIPSMDHRCRARTYWLRERRRWLSDVSNALRHADIAHVGISDLYRPINLDALRAAVHTPAMTVFARDTDELLKNAELRRASGRGDDLKSRVYDWAYESCMRYAVRNTDVCLLKGRDLFDRYAAIAKNPHLFQDTSYRREEIVSDARRRERVAEMMSSRPLRFVYCGRLEARKGVDRSIHLLARARERGVEARFDVIGDGPERTTLEGLSKTLGLADGSIQFLGRKPYGPELFAELSSYDALLFTPIAEDTPRMIFDGFACGLPLIGFDIGYVRERHDVDRAVEMIPIDDLDAGADLLARLDAGRPRLAQLSDAAIEAAKVNAAEAWYERRAQWTFDALDRHRARDDA